MAKIRVYELAKDLNMTNKVLLSKIKKMDIEVGSHMSSLDGETIKLIKKNLFDEKEKKVFDEKRIKKTVIRRRKKITRTEEKPGKDIVTEKKQDKKKIVEEKNKTPEKKELKPGKQKKKKGKKFKAAKIIKLPVVVDIQDEEQEPVVEEEKPKKKVKFIKAQPEPPNLINAEETDKKEKKKGRRKIQEEQKKKILKKISFKRKAIIEHNDLYENKRTGKKGKPSKPKKTQGQKTQITKPKAIKRRVKIDETIILAELAKRMGIKANEMIAKLMGLGVMATVNQTIDYERASLVAAEFQYEVEKASFEEETVLNRIADSPEQLFIRPPVVTIMGHVDHGKTSLLDTIRKSGIAESEAGGITQHIGAYNVKTSKGQVIFLDTPGHEAFTAMRSRGAKVTDIVILVVAADDGVMPQTIEAINHSKAANVPMIVAINKIDKDNADPDRVKRELSEHNILAEDWGGDAIFVNVSAKKKTGIDNLLEMVLLQAEMLELKANPDKFARGHVVESKLNSGRGPVATVLVQEGTLKSGQSVVCGIHYGKIRAMLDEHGRKVDIAGPSIPIEILGLTGVPDAGDEFITLADEKSAKQVSTHRVKKQRAKELAKSSRLSLESLFEKMEEGYIKDLNLIIKADVHGSIEALKESLLRITSDKVKINIIHSATGTVSESDISLAAVSNAIIMGFNVRPGAKVHDMAREENVDMRFYDIIYNAINDIKNAMIGLMESTFNELVVGRAEVREIFVIPKKGSIAGCFVTDGRIERGYNVRLLREGIIKYDDKLDSLKRFKDDVKEVQNGYECGIGLEKFNDIKQEDVIECYELEEVKPTLL